MDDKTGDSGVRTFSTEAALKDNDVRDILQMMASKVLAHKLARKKVVNTVGCYMRSHNDPLIESDEVLIRTIDEALLDIVKIYEDNLSIAAMEDVIEFYDTPSGKALAGIDSAVSEVILLIINDVIEEGAKGNGNGNG